MSAKDLQRLLDKVINSGLSTHSGIYAGIDPSLSMRLSERGEYEYVGLDTTYKGPADKLLRVSAFGGVAPTEDEVAEEIFGAQEGVAHDTIAGYYLGSFAGWVEEDDIRSNGSSGGVVTWLLNELIRRGEIDAVVHLKPGGSDGQLFSYQVSRTEEDVRAGSKSRYYPGELSAALREIREVPGRYAVVGIPSFIYELRLLQQVDSIFQDRIPYLIGLICGHQKTASYANYLAWRGGVAQGTLRSIDFRKKVAGEPANRYSTELSGVIDGIDQKKVIPQTDLFGTDWGLGFFKSNFSDFTQDALNETADIVLGDAWLPRYTPDSRGTNVVLVRNRHLLGLLDSARQQSRLYLEDVPVSEVVRSQSSLVRQSVLEVPYRFALLARKGETTPAIRREESPQTELSFVRRMTQRVRLATSRKSHLAYLDALQEGTLRAFDRRIGPSALLYKSMQLVVRVQRKLASEPRAVFPAIMRRIRR